MLNHRLSGVPFCYSLRRLVRGCGVKATARKIEARHQTKAAAPTVRSIIWSAHRHRSHHSSETHSRKRAWTHSNNENLPVTVPPMVLVPRWAVETGVFIGAAPVAQPRIVSATPVTAAAPIAVAVVMAAIAVPTVVMTAVVVSAAVAMIVRVTSAGIAAAVVAAATIAIP